MSLNAAVLEPLLNELFLSGSFQVELPMHGGADIGTIGYNPNARIVFLGEPHMNHANLLLGRGAGFTMLNRRAIESVIIAD